MDYRLPRQVFNPEITSVISREIKAQQTPVALADEEDMEQIVAVSETIKEKGIPDQFAVKKLKFDLGYGVFLKPDAKPIKRGQVIAPYSGELSIVPQNQEDDSAYAFSTLTDFLMSKEEQNAFDSGNKYHPKRRYILNLDADKKGNFTRYINHSAKPNIEAYFIEVPKNKQGLDKMPLEVIYFSSRVIRPGEQLLVSYEDGEESSYWEACGLTPFPMTAKTFMLNERLRIVHNKSL